MPAIETISFKSNKALLVRIKDEEALNSLWKAFDINRPSPCMVIVGGASGMNEADSAAIQKFFDTLLVPFLEKNKIAVIDGGTNTGVMQAIGKARNLIKGTFPLIGVIAEGIFNEAKEKSGSHPPAILETNHSHFILPPGNYWGDEAKWISYTATHLSGDKPSLTLLINGGDIAWEDAAASVGAGRRVLVARGSGRTADVIAETGTGKNIDPRAVRLLATKLVEIDNPFKRSEKFMQRIQKIFEPPKPIGGEDVKK